MRARGFTLIELLIAMAIFAFLIMLAGPMYGDFMANSQIRNAAENTLSGVRFAQTVAIKNNKPAKFVIDPAQPDGGWAVYLFDDEAGAFDNLNAAQSYQWKEGASRVDVTPQPPGATRVTFNGLGRVVANDDATNPLTGIDITNPSIATPRSLHIIVSAPGNSGTKLCDYAVSPPDPRACT